MNALGRETLRAAGLAGVPQIFGKMRDNLGGRCGLGVLHDVAGCDDIIGIYALGGIAACPACAKESHEYALIAHLQDDHGLDFIGIAEKMPVTDR